MTRTIALLAILTVGMLGTQASAQTPARDFSLKTLDGKQVTLKEHRGKVVLVNFWATWCIPCKAEMPILMDLQQTYGPKGFTVLAVSVDDDGAEIVAPWVEKNLFELNGKKQKVNFPVLLSSISMAEDYADIFAFPATFLVDANGNLVRRIDGALEEDDITAAVKSLMAGR